MNDVFICDAIRTPFGRYGGALASIRADDLAAIPIRALIDRNPNVDWSAVDDVIFGCAIKLVKTTATSRGWLFYWLGYQRLCLAQPLTVFAARAWMPLLLGLERLNPEKRI
jgi:hypothetical protein